MFEATIQCKLAQIGWATEKFKPNIDEGLVFFLKTKKTIFKLIE